MLGKTGRGYACATVSRGDAVRGGWSRNGEEWSGKRSDTKKKKEGDSKTVRRRTTKNRPALRGVTLKRGESSSVRARALALAYVHVRAYISPKIRAYVRENTPKIRRISKRAKGCSLARCVCLLILSSYSLTALCVSLCLLSSPFHSSFLLSSSLLSSLLFSSLLVLSCLIPKCEMENVRLRKSNRKRRMLDR